MVNLSLPSRNMNTDLIVLTLVQHMTLLIYVRYEWQYNHVTHELNFLLAEHTPKEKLFAITHLMLWVSHDCDCENVLYVHDLQMKISETLHNPRTTLALIYWLRTFQTGSIWTRNWIRRSLTKYWKVKYLFDAIYYLSPWYLTLNFNFQ